MTRMKLDNSFVFKRFRKELEAEYGPQKAAAIWRYAESELQKLESAEPDADKNSRTFGRSHGKSQMLFMITSTTKRISD